MKKLIVILAAATMLFAACSKKQDPKPVLTPQNATIKDITGNWLIVVDSAYTTSNGQTTINTVPNTNNTRYNFNADGTGTEVSTSATVNFTYTLVGGKLTIHILANGNVSADDLPFTIQLITADKLTLRLTFGNTYGDIVFTKN